MVKKKEVKASQHSAASASSKAHHSAMADQHKQDISISKLLMYNLLFFVPILVFAILAIKIGARYSDYFEASASVVAKILMVPFMMVLFFILVPFIRDREKVAGIRYSIVAFLVVGIGVSLPSALQGNFSLLLNLANYFGSYILLTFIFCPEVLGIERNLREWFQHGKQVSVIFIFLSIVMLYVVGFGALYYDIYRDPANPEAFSITGKKEPVITSFIYYSMVSFSTTGYGDITPISGAARFVFFIESMIGIVINVLFIAILLMFISNAESLSEKKEERELVTEVRKEEKKIEKEEREIRKIEKEVMDVEKKENFMIRFYRLIKGK